MKKIFVLAAILLSFCSYSYAATYQIDLAHSNIGFAVKHLMVGTTRGNFDAFSGSVDFDRANPETFAADVTIDAKSINTKVVDRDTHLKKEEFLDVEKFTSITFKGKRLNPKADGYDLVGDLTIKGVTKEITIPVWISGPVKSPYGAQVIGISGEITINRQDYGVSFNKAMDQGGAIVDDNVKIIVDIEAKKEPKKEEETK